MLNLVMGVLQFFWVWTLGFALLSRLRLQAPRGYRPAVAFAIGQIAITYALMALGLFGAMQAWVVLPLAALSLAASLPVLAREAPGLYYRLHDSSRKAPFAAALIALFTIVYALGACVPEREVDSLWYHLYAPQYYLHHGGWALNVPFNLPSHYPMNAHLHYVISLAVGNDATAKAFTALHFIPLLIAAAAAARRYAGPRYALPVCVLLLACVHYKLPVMANIYRPLQLHILLSYLLLFHYFESGRKSSLGLAALFCGMALGTKLTAALFAFAPQWILFAFFGFFRSRVGVSVSIRRLALYTLVVWAMASPWLIKSAILTGNPFFPSLSGIFGAHEDYQEVADVYAKVHGFAPLKAASVSEWSSTVIKQASWTVYNNDVIFLLGGLSLLLLPVLGLKRRLWLWSGCLLVYCMFPLLWGHAVVRLFSECYGLVVVAAIAAIAGTLERIPSKRWLLAALMIAAAASFFINKSVYLDSPNIRWFGGVYLSEEARRAWLDERGVFTNELFALKDWMDDNLSDEETVYVFNSEYPYYFEGNTIFSDELFGKQLPRWLADSPERAAEELKRLDAAWLIDGGKHPPASLAPQDAEGFETQWRAFESRYLTLERRESEARLYRFDFSGE